MSVQDQRLPLGEFTNSRLNRMSLLSSGNGATNTHTANTTTDANKKNSLATGHDENMATFNLNTALKPNLFHSSVFPSIGSNGMTNDKDMLLNESPTNRILNTIISRKRFDNNYKSSSSSTTTANNTNSNILKFSDTITKDYSEVSKRLQVRLQFAYYKLRTKQMNLKFADLKNKMTSHNVRLSDNTNSNKINKTNKNSTKQSRVKRRKLVVSQGNYRTPAKHHPRIAIDEVISADSRMSTPSTMVDTTNNTTSHHITMNTNQNGIIMPHFTITKQTDKDKEDDANETLTQHNNSTLLNCSITPVRNPLKRVSSASQLPAINMVTAQETPMSVKAAKSLIQLFSSINT